MIERDFTVSIAIPSKDRVADIDRCIASIRAQRTQPDEIVIVDQSKEPYGFEDARLIKHLYAPHLRGLPEARNVAANACSSDLVMFLDDDVELITDCVGEVKFAFARHDDAVGVACVVVQPGSGRLGRLKAWARGTTYSAFGWGFFNSKPIRNRSGIQLRTANGCTAFRKRLFELEQFDERMQGYSLGEDWEFSVSARKHGTLWLAEGAVVMHYHSALNRWNSHRLLVARWNNFLYFFDKHGAGASTANRFWRQWWMFGESLHWLKAGIGFPVLGIRSAAAREIEARSKRPAGS